MNLSFGFFHKHWLALLVVISGLPGLALVLRGVVWGSDSFAFWAVSCGQQQFADRLTSPVWFVWFVQNVVACNILVLACVVWFLYFLALLGLFFFSKKWFKEKAYLVPLYAATLTPLFFVEALRFENDFFGWTTAFIVLGLVSICFQYKNDNIKLLCGSLAAILPLFALQIWLPSIFLLVLAVFLYDSPIWWQYLCVGVALGVVLISQVGYATHSVTQGVGMFAVAEEIPLVGLIFILHIIGFFNDIPKPLKYYGWGLILLGVLKSKYMFLATPLLLAGLLTKELDKGITIRGKTWPVMFFVLLLGAGWFVSGLFMYPTQADMVELKQAVQLAQDKNIPLYNDWGDGWMLVSLGYDTKYKISPPMPDYNSLPRPYVAWAKQEIAGCENITNKIRLCE